MAQVARGVDDVAHTLFEFLRLWKSALLLAVPDTNRRTARCVDRYVEDAALVVWK